MDTNKRKSSSDASSNTQADDWKSKEHRNLMVKKIADYLIKRAPPSWTQNPPAFKKLVEKFEKEVFDSAKDKDEYIARINARMKGTKIPFQIDDESNLLTSKVHSGKEKEPNAEWQEQIYQKIHTMKNKYIARLNNLYHGICKRLQKETESVPQEQMASSIVKCKHHKLILENIFEIFRVKKNAITPDFQKKIDKAEQYIHFVEQNKTVPPSSNVSRGEETSKVMGQQSSQLKEPIFHQVEIQIRNSHQHENQVSDKQVPDDENIVQQQTSGEIAPPPIISTSGIIASPLVENDQEKENSQDQTNISDDDSSPEIQHLIDVLSSISDEALMTSCGDIGMLVCFNDDMSKLEPLIGPPIGAIGSNLEGVFVTDSQARYLSRSKFVPRERKPNDFHNSTPIIDGVAHSPTLEKLLSNSNTSEERYAFMEEIEEINRKLIDTEIVVDREELYRNRGLIVKLYFHSVTVNPSPILSEYTPHQKPIIEPLWLHIPANYPQSSVLILDDMPSESSDDPSNVSVKVHVKFRLCLRRLSEESLSLTVIATLWDNCAREAWLEYAQLLGGGTFSSKHGKWETCPRDDDDDDS